MVPIGVRVLTRQLRADSIHVCPCSFQRDTRLQSGVNLEKVIRACRCLRGSFERERGPQVDRPVGKLERPWQYADDVVRDAVQDDLLPDDRRVGTEPTFPESMVQHHDAMLADLAFLGSERSAEHRRYAQDVEEWCGHASREQPDWFSRSGEVGGDGCVCRHRLEGAAHLRPIEKVGGSDNVVQHPFALPLLPDLHQLMGIGIGERSQENCVNRREDCGVCPDAESQCQHRDDRDAGLPPQQTHSVSNVLYECAHPPPPAPQLARDRESAVFNLLQTLGGALEKGIPDSIRPQPHHAAAARSHLFPLRVEQTRHVVAECPPQPARKCEPQQHAIHVSSWTGREGASNARP